MTVIVYGNQSDRSMLQKAVSDMTEYCYRNISVCGYSDYDIFIDRLRGSPPEVVIVTADGADGMEGVIAARNILERVPIVWFSDDKGFGAQSYRLGCAYFHKKPVSPQIISAAIARCV